MSDTRAWVLASTLATFATLGGANLTQAKAQDAVWPAHAQRVTPMTIGERAILDADGNPVAVRGPGTGPTLTTLRSGDGTRWEAPAYQRWLASVDGRSILGVGDPSAPEHPFHLEFTLFRDGVEVPTLEHPPMDPESRFTLAADGRVGIAGHAPGARGSGWVLALDAAGERLFRHDLPRGAEAIGLAHVGSALWVLVVQAPGSGGLPRVSPGPGKGTHTGGAQPGRRGVLWRFDPQGATELVAFEPVGSMDGAQEWVGLGAVGGLVRGPDALTFVDAGEGGAGSARVRWRREGRLRPAGPHAWTRLDTPRGRRVAVVHGDVRRRVSRGASRGATRPRLEVLDLATGASRGVRELDAMGPLALLRLVSDGRDLIVRWMGEERRYGWVE